MLKTRIITAALLINGFLYALFCASHIVWACLCLTFTILASHEWTQLSRLNAMQSFVQLLITTVLGGLVVYLMHTNHGNPSITTLLLAASMVWLVVVPFYLFHEYLLSNSKLFQSLLGILVVIGNLIAFIGLHQLSPIVLLIVIATVSLSDSAAYFGGKKFGRHKLAPTVSPGKTWEGVFTAIAVVAIYALVVSLYFEPKLGILLGLISLVAWSVMGDLFESKLKRKAKMKDSGNLLPGHGGILDRIDGMMPAATLAFFYISVIYNLQ